MRKQLDCLLTTVDLCAIFDRNEMTIYLWRKNRGLPVVKIASDHKPVVRFDWRSVRAWAQANQVKVADPTALRRILKQRASV
jgi:hypothetical protein